MPARAMGIPIACVVLGRSPQMSYAAMSTMTTCRLLSTDASHAPISKMD